MKIGDVVRIAFQPDNQFMDLVGQRGHIEEIQGQYLRLETFSQDGRATGGGTVTMRSVVPENDPSWAYAKEVLDQERARVLKAAEDRQRLWLAHVNHVATKNGVTAAQVIAIRQDLARLEGW